MTTQDFRRIALAHDLRLPAVADPGFGLAPTPLVVPAHAAPPVSARAAPSLPPLAPDPAPMV